MLGSPRCTVQHAASHDAHTHSKATLVRSTMLRFSKSGGLQPSILCIGQTREGRKGKEKGKKKGLKPMSCLSWQGAAFALWGFVSDGRQGHAMQTSSRGSVVGCCTVKCFEGIS
jgi:hypothetical protein